MQRPNALSRCGLANLPEPSLLPLASWEAECSVQTWKWLILSIRVRLPAYVLTIHRPLQSMLSAKHLQLMLSLSYRPQTNQRRPGFYSWLHFIMGRFFIDDESIWNGRMPNSIAKYPRQYKERWLSGWECGLLLQRTLVWLPVKPRRFARACNFISRGVNSFSGQYRTTELTYAHEHTHTCIYN